MAVDEIRDNFCKHHDERNNVLNKNMIEFDNAHHMFNYDIIMHNMLATVVLRHGRPYASWYLYQLLYQQLHSLHLRLGYYSTLYLQIFADHLVRITSLISLTLSPNAMFHVPKLFSQPQETK